MEKITAIVLAAGQGKRMNTNVAKQFLLLKEKPILYYSLKAFEDSSVDEIILVAGKEQMNYCHEELIKRYQFKKISKVIVGGKERYDSVYQALVHADAPTYVLIHDGARPFLTKELIERIVNSVKKDKACIIGTPVKETIKVVDSDGIITATPNRSSLWAAQTPQAFDFLSIKKAYDMLYEDPDREGLGITDDAMVYEYYLNKSVKMMMGDYNNLKVTTPEDLIIAEQIVNSYIV